MSALTVTKKNGSIVPFDISKIKKMIDFATRGLDVNPLLLESKINLTFKDKIKTSDIQQNLIISGIELIDVEEPDWVIVVGRLATKLLHSEIYKNIKMDHNDYLKFLHYAINHGYYRNDILENYSDEDIENISKVLDKTKDFNFTIAQVLALKDKYLVKNKKGGFIEYPQFSDLTSSLILGSVEEEKKRLPIAKEFFYLIKEELVSLATPFKGNLRLSKGNTGSCFKGHELVLTKMGNKPINEIKIGDQVLTHTGLYQTVYKTMDTEYEGNYITLDIFGRNDTLSATDYHPILAIKKEDISCIRPAACSGICINRTGQKNICYSLPKQYKTDCELLNYDFSDKISWIEMDSLNKGDFVSVSYNNTINNENIIDLVSFIEDPKWFDYNDTLIWNKSGDKITKRNRYLEIDEEFMTFLGYYIAEGHLSKNENRICFTFGSKELDYINELTLIIKNKFNSEAVVRQNKDNSTTIMFTSTIIKNLLLNIVGTGFNTKKLNPLIMEQDPKLQKHILKACFRGDGCSITNGIKLTLCNEVMINQLFDIALRNKFHPTLSKSKTKKEHHFTPYHLILNYRYDKEFIELINKNLEKIKINNDKTKSDNGVFWINNYYFMKIKNKIIMPIKEKVYNIEVENDHSYSVSGINVHNCFILTFNDSLAQITKAWVDVAKISKEGGGIGLYFGYLRPGQTYTIKVVNSNKVNKWVKIINDIAVAVNQRGIRPGAVTPILDWWYLDIEDFIEMKTETGQMDLREKCFDLFPQIVGDKYFFESVREDREVYLFNHFEYKELTGIDVIPLIDEEMYNVHLHVKELIENGKLKSYKKISAKHLWKESIRIWFETGDFYITSKDNLNLSNYMKKHAITNGANLCVESFSFNIPPSEWVAKGNKDGFDTIESDGMYHSCNLTSINVANCVGHGAARKLERACIGAVRMLDNSIDTGTMPVFEAKQSSFAIRNVGIGTVGVADWVAYNKLSYEKPEDLNEIEKLQEQIAYYCYNASIDLAIEKGPYPWFEKADYSKLFGKTGEELNATSLNGFDWIEVINRIKKHGIRNMLLLATAPNTSSALVQNATASFLPPHNKFNVQTLAKISVPVIPKYLKTRNWYYKSKFHYDPVVLIEVTKRLQKWLDTGISMEVPINTELANAKRMSDSFLDGFINGTLKAVYYSVTVDGKKLGCTDCAN